MTWWWGVCRAAWRRWDEWRGERVDPDFDGFAWFDEVRPFFADEDPQEESYDEGPVYVPHDVKIPTELDLAAIARPYVAPARPGRRYVGRHRAVPNDPVRRPS